MPPSHTASPLSDTAGETLRLLLRRAQARGEHSVARIRLVVLAVAIVEELVWLATHPWSPLLLLPVAVLVVGVGFTAASLRRVSTEGGPVPFSVGLDAALVVGAALPGVIAPDADYAGAFAYPPFVFFIVAIVASALRLSRPLVRLSIVSNVAGALLLLLIDLGRGVAAGADVWLMWCAAFVAVGFTADAVALRSRRLVYEGAAAVLRAEQARAALGSYVSEEVAELAMTEGAAEERRRAVAVLQVAIGPAEGRPPIAPERLLTERNAWLAEVMAVVHAHGGLVDTLDSDGLRVLFGAPTPAPDAASRALRGAAGVLRASDAHDGVRAASGLPPLAARVGVHFGEVVVGHLGAAGRRRFTVVGAVVREAAQLAGEATRRGVGLVASDAVVSVAGTVDGGPTLSPGGRLTVDGHALTVWIA